MEENNNGLEMIEKGELDSLIKDSIKLGCLIEMGVDNWSGYDDAMELYDGEIKKHKIYKGDNMEFKIGDRVKDIITGYEGIILVYCKYSHNEDTVGLQKTSLNHSSLPDDFQWFDVTRLEMVEKGAFSDKAVEPEKISFSFLDIIKDPFIEKIKGPITGIYTYFTGCVRYEVTVGTLNEKNDPIRYFIPSKLAILVKESKEKVTKNTGGPMSHPKMY